MRKRRRRATPYIDSEIPSIGCREMAEGSDGMTNDICYTSDPSLPLDMFFEILSWLPVHSVIVSKCVCKAWTSVIEEPKFVKKHMNQASKVILFDDPFDFDGTQNKRRVVGSSEGLVLEQGDTFDYSINNPATRQVLRLPNPVKEPGCMLFSYVFESMVYKLIHLHAKGLGSPGLGCEVLTVGEDLAWRVLNIPSLKNIYEGNARVFSAAEDSDICYIIEIPRDLLVHPTILFLNVVTDSAKCCEIPKKFFWDWNNVYPLMWKGKLSLTTIFKNRLIIWVLENYKTNQWADREIIIPLTSAKEFFQAGDKVYALALSDTLLTIEVNDHIFIYYDIEEKKVKSARPMPVFEDLWFKLRPSLVHLKGMRAEEEIIDV